jgi:FKBP-type peptidyl-prolyl cis-trans isomerase FkpA
MDPIRIRRLTWQDVPNFERPPHFFDQRPGSSFAFDAARIIQRTAMMRKATLFLGFAAVLSLGACEKVPEPTGGASPAVTKEPEAPEPADLGKKDVVVGTGAEAKDGDKVWVHYTGKLAKNNKQFDSSVGKKPLDFEIGKGGVIKGWELGIVGMKVGGKRQLTIPSKLGYGKEGNPPSIPPNATLLFDIELVSVGSPPGAAEAPDAGAGDAGSKDAGAKDAGAKKDEKKPAVVPVVPAKKQEGLNGDKK